METLNATDSAQAFVKGINDNFTEAGISTQFSKDVSAGDIVSGLNSAFSGIAGDINALNKDVSASDFVDSINHNFGEYHQGEPPAEGTISIPMQGGKMENGYITGRNTNTANFLRYIHSVNMVDVSGCSITGVNNGNSETLTIFCFNSTGAYLGTGTVGNLQSGTRYVKFMLNKSSSYTTVNDLIVSYSGSRPTLHKNTVPALETQHDVSFETNLANVFPNEGFNISGDIGKRYYDNGFIKLPSNYSMNGDAVPLVVFVHGTSGHSFSGTTGRTSSISGYEDFYGDVQLFIVKNGYALCDCSGATSKHGTGVNTLCTPSFAAAIVDEVSFLMANYNLRQTGIYLYGKSSGGLMVNLSLLVEKLHSLFTINAIGALAPSLSPMASMKKYAAQSATTAMNKVATELGLGAPFSLGTWGTNEKSVVIDNIDKWLKVDAFFSATDISEEDINTAIAACYDEGETDVYRVQTAKSICDVALRETVAPTKIWIAGNDGQSDGAVSVGMTALVKEMAERRRLQVQQPIFERERVTTAQGFYGGHHFDDIGVVTNGEVVTPAKTRTVVVNGETLVTTEIYAQLVDWFNTYETQYNQNN